MGYRFAVCDDDAQYARYICQLAGRWGQTAQHSVETECFPSAEAFLFRYEEQQDFDVLLLDIEMAGMDGVELARTVRRVSDDVQIIFITGYTDYLAEGCEVSALHYLTKPVDGDKFFDNAIEASAALPEEKRLIRVYIDMKGTQLYISFTNLTASGKRVKIGGRFLSTKGAGHGFGLIRVDTIVERLGGYLSRNSEGGAFTTEILRPAL